MSFLRNLLKRKEKKRNDKFGLLFIEIGEKSSLIKRLYVT
jgi:hypothetical protein